MRFTRRSPSVCIRFTDARTSWNARRDLASAMNKSSLERSRSDRPGSYYAPRYESTRCERSGETREISLLADEVDLAVPDDEPIRDVGRSEPVPDAEVGDEGVALAEASAVDVADVRRFVDGHRPGDEVVIAATEEAQALVARRRERDRRLDARPAGRRRRGGTLGEGDRGERDREEACGDAHESERRRRGAESQAAPR